MQASSRNSRQHAASKVGDQRTPFQIDRDRLLYSTYFRRLSQVTQVASASEGSIFHNRLTHSLKVAQIARRLAEKLIQDTSSSNSNLDLINKCGGLDPDVVESAALAHDLGHPPFGHVAEKELDKLSKNAGLKDGFEGNAQTFRILTLLEANRPSYPGLDLTKATLNATFKYPWFRAMDEEPDSKKKKKFSAYHLDQEAFQFAREGTPDEQQTLEASVMEFADDVTYSIHDLEDFYLAGLIPLKDLINREENFNNFVAEWVNDLKDEELKKRISQPHQKEIFKTLIDLYNSEEYSDGSFAHIAHIKNRSSEMIQRYVHSVAIQEQYGEYGYLKRQEERELELKFFQRIVWKYVIYNPRLATQQHGQKKIIKTLFDFYKSAVESKQLYVLPVRFSKNVHLANQIESGETNQQVRIAVDIVASFSENEAVLMFRRLTGIEQGSVMDYVN